jgi:iron complex outermembrane receptor protein
VHPPRLPADAGLFSRVPGRRPPPNHAAGILAGRGSLSRFAVLPLFNPSPAPVRAGARSALRRALRLAAACLCSQALVAAGEDAGLADLSLEELAQVEVTSVSKRPERLLDAPASIYVISHDDIRRSGATSLPEALRLAPNLQVAQANASQYAITARGFNNANNLGNKLLVLIDGRTVYSPIYSGVFWDQQDVLLEDVERIEVISGPGGTLWGANAVNGVINVITRSAKDTQGGYVTLGGGNAEYGGAFRYGARLGETGSVRLYAKTNELNNTERADGTAIPDGWTMSQAGFRADWGHATRSFTFQGDLYEGRGHDRVLGGPVKANGANLLGRWNERFDSGADLQVQAYFDRSQRRDLAGLQGDADTYDIQFQNGIPLGAHKLLWGGGYREARDNVESTSIPLEGFPIDVFLVTTFVPQHRTLRWENLFVQDEIALGDALTLTAGVKFESNDYTGWETLPSARLAWRFAEDQLLWTAISRTVRAPARLDRDFFVDIDVPAFPAFNQRLIVGGPGFESEIADVAEIGYRAQPWTRVTWSLTGFYSEYSRLRSGEPPPAEIQNGIDGTTYGVEAWLIYQATDAWRLSGGLVELRKDLRQDPGAVDPDGPSNLGNDPEHQWMLRSTLNPSPRLDLDVTVRGVSRLPDPLVPAYTAVDARVAWRADKAFELFLAGYNLFDPSHPEFGAAPGRSEIPRSFYAGMNWRM